MKLGTPLLQRLERCVNCVQENGQELKVIFDKWYYLSQAECEFNHINLTEIERIDWGVNIFERNSLWSLFGVSTFAPGWLTNQRDD
ncbi:MAG: hypothetical protein H0V82_07890 [Candidatus Protochlamydia sp.]|nr:hypothetical protein [Candidatus Protochlamydia sp.]